MSVALFANLCIRSKYRKLPNNLYISICQISPGNENLIKEKLISILLTAPILFSKHMNHN